MLWIRTLLVVGLLTLLTPFVALGQVSEIIDADGDRSGNTLDSTNLTVDRSGNVYVTGSNSDNAFRVEASSTCSTTGTLCTITEIIDLTGDGTGNLDQTTGRYPRSGSGGGNRFPQATSTSWDSSVTTSSGF